MKPREKHVWTWPIAGYLFLGGLGSGISIVVAVADLFFDLAAIFSFSLIIAVGALAFGSFLLIFELGRPFQFWRVFSKQKAVLTFGAWMVTILILLDIVYLGCFISWMPWFGMLAVQKIFALLALIIGCGVLMYTGIELSSMKGRLLWNTPLLPLLFALSGILTGIASCTLCIGFWPYEGSAQLSEYVYSFMRALCAGFIVVTFLAAGVYVSMLYTSTTTAAREAMSRWLFGSYSVPFWGGLVAVGLILPLILFALGSGIFDIFAYASAIVGGIFLRFLVVYSDDRQQLSGEVLYWNHLPQGDEDFLNRNWG